MNSTNVTTTRMELTRLKKKLVVARRGHKLLKDKRDEMMRQFLLLVEENKKLRLSVEAKIKATNIELAFVNAEMPCGAMDEALLVPKQEVSVDVTFKNIMSVNVPQFKSKTRTSDPWDVLSYSFATTSAALDDAVAALAATFDDMLRLAECEKACWLLSSEIEKTVRRVNALEYVVIPTTADSIKYITMKIDENERGIAVRLMKVKDMVLK